MQAPAKPLTPARKRALANQAQLCAARIVHATCSAADAACASKKTWPGVREDSLRHMKETAPRKAAFACNSMDRLRQILGELTGQSLVLVAALALAACGSHPTPAASTVDPHARALAATTAPRLIAPASGVTLPPGSYLSAQIANEGGDADIVVDPPTPGASIVWDGAHPCMRWDPQPSQVDAGPVEFVLVGVNPAGRSTIRFTASATSTPAAGLPGLPSAKG